MNFLPHQKLLQLLLPLTRSNLQSLKGSIKRGAIGYTSLNALHRLLPNSRWGRAYKGQAQASCASLAVAG